MIDRLMALAAVAVMAAFLGILVWHVPRLDLILVCGFTFVLVAWDFLTSSGKTKQ